MRLPHPREPLHHYNESRRGDLREMVFGLEDGLISTMGVITGVAAGTGSRTVVLLAGIVVVFVESLSMAAGSYLSNKSQNELEARMLREELHEIRHEPEKERRELHEFYKERGFPREERDILVARFMSDEQLLLEEMAHKELGIHPGRKAAPVRSALIMLLAYFLGGLVPLAAYLVTADPARAIPWSVALTGAALLGLGAWKGRFVGGSRWRSALEMFLVAMGAAGLGYLVGRVAAHLLGGALPA